MAVIPPDAGIRMRTQADSGPLQPLAPIRGVPAGLPEFQLGQAFTARIQELLPDNTYKALVAGKQLTLALPEGANPGDVLELEVVDRTGHTIIAKRSEGEPVPTQTDGRAYPYTRISDAGRLIGNLLPPEGEAPQPIPLNRGQPVAPQPPATGAELAPSLQKAVSQSGLFYEAHQAQWVAGERPLNALRAEPQGQLPPQAPPTRPDQAMPHADRIASPAANIARGPENPAAGSDTQAVARLDSNVRAGEAAVQRSEGQTQSGTSAAIPEAIRNIVQQQLDAAATQRMAWHGEVWPGQNLDWAIQRDAVEDRNAGSPDGTEVPRWSTSLRLTMPILGTVDATVQLAGNGVRIKLAADSTAAGNLREQAPSLMQALAATGLTVQTLDIRNEE
jgi:hypothetical protein